MIIVTCPHPVKRKSGFFLAKSSFFPYNLPVHNFYGKDCFYAANHIGIQFS